MADPPAKGIRAPVSKYCADCFLLKSTEIVISQLGNITLWNKIHYMKINLKLQI